MTGRTGWKPPPPDPRLIGVINKGYRSPGERDIIRSVGVGSIVLYRTLALGEVEPRDVPAIVTAVEKTGLHLTVFLPNQRAELLRAVQQGTELGEWRPLEER